MYKSAKQNTRLWNFYLTLITFNLFSVAKVKFFTFNKFLYFFKA